MATRRTVITAATAVVVVLIAVGVSAWPYLRPSAQSDCATVNDMIKYSKSENDRMRSLIPTSIDDPQKLVDAYQTRETRLRQYADQIHDTGLREKADTVVNLNHKMLDAWRQTIPGPGSNSDSTSQDFQRTYSVYAAQSQKAGQDLQAACPA